MAGPGQPHGGMLAAARRAFPNAPLPLIDLSTGINPSAYPIPPLDPDSFTRLPDASAAEALQRAAACAYHLADPDMAVAAPGTQILISLLPHLLRIPAPARVAILGPTYAEHEATWRRAGHDVHAAATTQDLASADIAILCNPNNPDGRRIEAASLLPLASTLAARGGRLVADEAFADLEPPGISLAPFLPHPGIVVLRSFGKTYGLAGLRLGFALAAPPLARQMRLDLGPWAVSGPALTIASATLADTPWRAAQAARRHADAVRLDALAAGAGLSLVGGTNLFRLYESESAPRLYAALGGAGVIVRRFAGSPHRLRFGLPGPEDAWRRLADALTQG